MKRIISAAIVSCAVIFGAPSHTAAGFAVSPAGYALSPRSILADAQRAAIEKKRQERQKEIAAREAKRNQQRLPAPRPPITVPSAKPPGIAPPPPAAAPSKKAKKKETARKKTPPAPVNPNSGSPAAVSAKEGAPFFPSAKVDSLIKSAKKLIGRPYVYGGTTPKGFDCSGFLFYLFKEYGHSIPRTADAQYHLGKKVKNQSALVKGDLVFFITSGREVSHCGLYIGHGQFIHASSSKGIRIDKLSNSYWKPKYIGGKHVIK